jgi:23S rRNA pseudouridine2605 synthase
MNEKAGEAKLWRYCHAAGGKLPKGTIVGGLDGAQEGLLLISNEAEVARLLSLAAAGWVSHFMAQFKGAITAEQLAQLNGTPVLDGIHFGPVTARHLQPQGKAAWVDIALREGRGRNVGKLLAYAGLKPARVARTAFGPYKLGGLLAGALEEVPRQDWQQQLGGKFKTSNANRERKIQGAASRSARR